MPVQPDTLFQVKLDQAVALYRQGKDEAAERLARLLAATAPDHAMPPHLLGLLAERAGDVAAALPLLRRAADLAPQVVAFQAALGRAARAAGDVGQMAASALAVATLEPETLSARMACARLMHELSRPDEAVAALAAATRIRGDGLLLPTAAAWRLPAIPRSAEDLARCQQSYRAAVKALEDTDAPLPLADVLETATNFHGGYQGANDRPQQEIIARYYLRNCKDLAFIAPHLRAGRVRPVRRRRIGLCSSHLGNHTVGKLFRGLIAELDRRRFEVLVFANAPGDDPLSRGIAAAADAFHVLPRGLLQARQMLADAELDLLLYPDIGMTPLSYFLAFARLAPVQCASWGHGVTTGIPTVDYFLSSALIEADDPRVAQDNYSETLVRLDLLPSFLDPLPTLPAEGGGPDLGFAEGRTLYCCPQTLFKFAPGFDALLRGVLTGDPNGVLVLIEGRPGWSDILRQRWRATMPEVASRIHFIPRQNQLGFFRLVRRADVILDPPTFGGGLSSFECLALGVPIVTWPDLPLMSARITLGYYRQMAVLDAVAAGPEDYVALAVRLGTDRPFNRHLRERIRSGLPRLIHRHETVEAIAAFFDQAIAAAG